MSDSSRILSALTAKLIGDATLASLMPDGVYLDVSAKGKTRVVIVSLQSSTDSPMFRGRGFETSIYLVKAVELATSGSNANAAAARIDALLDHGTLTMTGYDLTMMRRIERIEYTEVDQDTDARWQHRGGLYEVIVSS